MPRRDKALISASTKADHIVCISANPALDRRVRLESLKIGEVNRAASGESFGGGKAAHVAMAALALGAQPTWIGFLGGATGEECAAKLRGLGLEVLPVALQSPTRLNLEILHDHGTVTEILEPGHPPGAVAMQEFTRTLVETLQTDLNGAPVSISGSLPAGMPSDFFASLARHANSQRSPVFLDTSGAALAQSLAAKPALVKINRDEARQLLQSPINNPADALNAARQIIDRGAQSAAVTLGGDGIIWLESKEGPAWLATPPKLKPVSTVGSGDTTLAGFVLASMRGFNSENTIRFAAACGAANCLAPIPGAIQRSAVDALQNQITVTKLASA